MFKVANGSNAIVLYIHPIKQGLKRDNYVNGSGQRYGSLHTSNKTRIET